MPVEGTASTILALLRDGRKQAQDLAAAIGIDTSAVRRHLESLRADGLVDSEDVVEGPGRPKKMYGITPRGREAFPRDYALLLDLVLAKVREAGGRDDVERLMASIARDLAATIQKEPDPARRLDALIAFYNSLGFEATIERTREGYALVQRNCIFLRTAVGDPKLLCERFDEGIMRAALGARVEFEGSLATGALACRHHLIVPHRRARSSA